MRSGRADLIGRRDLLNNHEGTPLRPRRLVVLAGAEWLDFKGNHGTPKSELVAFLEA